MNKIEFKTSTEISYLGNFIFCGDSFFSAINAYKNGSPFIVNLNTYNEEIKNLFKNLGQFALTENSFAIILSLL